MKEQTNLQKSNVNLAMNIENLLNDETRRLVGYIMPILESMDIGESQKASIKKILYTYKNNLSAMLINEMSNNVKSNNQ